MIKENQTNTRLDVYIAERELISRSASQKLIENGFVRVNGVVCQKNYRLRLNDEIEYDIPDPENSKILPQDIPINIVYEDNDLILVNKAKAMVVHPAPGNWEKTLVNALLYHCGDSLSGIGGVIRPGIVHRIDKDTSGLLVIAKNDKTHIFLSDQLKDHKTNRIYEAVICGKLKEENGTINLPIDRHPSDRKKMAVISSGREAITHYTGIKEYITREGTFTHIKLNIETGRTHQIRVHMAYIGRPVLGDTVYGGDKSKFAQKYSDVLSGQCLHAKTLQFIHPSTGELLTFDTSLPDYFNIILEKLRNFSDE